MVSKNGWPPDWFYVIYMWTCVALWIIITALILWMGATP